MILSKSALSVGLIVQGFIGGLVDVPSVEGQEVIVRYDMTALNSWNLSNAATRRLYFDQTQFVTSLQGLANRQTPQLYIRYNASLDDFWWARMAEPGGWLHGRTVQQATSITDLLTRFAHVYNGVVVWDERVPATANLAGTIAGCDNLLAIRYDTTAGSLYQQLVAGGPQLPVQVRLIATDGSPMFTGQGTIPGTSIPSTGSAKCDAYVWLVEHYLKTGKTDPKRMGYFLDGYWLTSWASAGRTNHTLNNQDFVIARKGLIFDLNVWDDEPAVDDPNQPPGTDAATLRTILRAAYDRFIGDGFIHVAGFVPWAYKYTTWASAGGTHDPVPTEWRYAEILSCHNAFMDADAIGLANMANASFFQHYPLEEVYPQPNKPTRDALIAKGVLDADGHILPKRYVAHYVGDYDAAAWLYQKLPSIWTDSNRGTEPLSWAFNPNLSERFPLGMAWTRQTATANDTFISGDCGSGYINPGHLVPPRLFSGLPSGVAAWEAHNQPFFARWDISAVGFVIDGYAPCMSMDVMDAYARFAPDGIVPQKVPLQGWHNGMPYTKMRYDLPGNVTQAVDIIETFLNRPVPQFDTFRSILQTPTYYKQVDDELRLRRGSEVMIVDLYTLLWLVREYEAHPELYLWPYSPYAGATQVQTTPGQNQGLAPVAAGEGPVVTTTYAGRSAWRVASSQYLYLAVDDGFHRRDGEPITVSVDFHDQGSGSLWIQYDAADFGATLCGMYKATTTVSRTNTSSWRTATWVLPDARFANAQNGQADLRIYNGGDSLYVSRVRIAYHDTGSLQVTLEPSEAVTDGARWRLTSGDDTDWKESGQILTDILVGDYTLTFNTLSGWNSPPDGSVTIVKDVLAVREAHYERRYPGDLDEDGDVDLADFGRLQSCFSRDGTPQTLPECVLAHLDGDDDVDYADLIIFMDCMTGSGIPADPACTSQ